MMSLAVLGNGCAYVQNRANDAMDILDVGITINNKVKPDFALFLDAFALTPLGFSSVDGKILGVNNRRIGWQDHTDHSWGILLVGSEKKGSGKFNPADPHLARADQRNQTTWPRFDKGLVGLVFGKSRSPWTPFVQWDRAVHLGWVGVYLICRPVDVADFVLGWTTLDIMGDDLAGGVKQ